MTTLEPPAKKMRPNPSIIASSSSAASGIFDKVLPLKASSFPIHPLSRFRAACPPYKEPEEIVSFSYDEQHKVQMDDRELKYYTTPRTMPPQDLSEGYERQITRDPNLVDHVDGLLEALSCAGKPSADASQELKRMAVPHQADFVMYRGMMTRIFCTPFSRRDSWEMNASRYKGTIYIEDNVTAQRIEERKNVPEKQRRMMYWGYRFEQLATTTEPSPQTKSNDKAEPSPKPHGYGRSQERQGFIKTMADDPGEVVDTNREYCSIFRTQLGCHRIIMGAEIDCIEGKFKLLKFWAQSFLAGIRKVVVGFRDKDGMLSNVETMHTREMARQVRGVKGMWEANVCMNFADNFLSWLGTAITIDDPNAVYRIRYAEPFQSVEVQYLGNKSGTGFLPSFLTHNNIVAGSSSTDQTKPNST
ncbi:decapping endonuclease targeting mRNA [Mycoemilia scoparia]|uniref:Decapping nuclease n=1 Tax=Mycoemilia scoparia TaxID=417184 RepID=A0A9W8A3Q4_9FUNG|nr:decapping endonuclease targeting mRNA [Mycoemilia scoparia]